MIKHFLNWKCRKWKKAEVENTAAEINEFFLLDYFRSMYKYNGDKLNNNVSKVWVAVYSGTISKEHMWTVTCKKICNSLHPLLWSGFHSCRANMAINYIMLLTIRNTFAYYPLDRLSLLPSLHVLCILLWEILYGVLNV